MLVDPPVLIIVHILQVGYSICPATLHSSPFTDSTSNLLRLTIPLPKTLAQIHNCMTEATKVAQTLPRYLIRLQYLVR